MSGIQAFFFGILAAWSQLAEAYPGWTYFGGSAIIITSLLAGGAGLGHVLMRKETKVATGPLFVISGLIVFALCGLWSLADWILPHIGDPPLRTLEEYLLLWTAAGEVELIQTAFKIPEGAPLLLSQAVRVPLGLAAASTVYLAIVRILGSALAEMKSLERKPDDILRRERIEAARKRKEAIDAGLPIPADAQVHTIPLADDRFGRIYKWLGHWTTVELVEYRFVRWQRGMVNTVISFTGAVLLPLYFFPRLPVALWVGCMIALHALRRNLRTPEKPKEEEPEAPEEVEEEAAVTSDDARPKELLESLSNARGTLNTAPPSPAAQDADSSVQPQFDSQALLRELLQELSIDALYSHQAAAANAYLDGKNVLLSTAPMSGRRVALDLLTFYALLAEGKNVLVLSTSPAAARKAEKRFTERAERTHWKWNILATNTSDRGKIDPSQAQPALMFTDPTSLHRDVLAQAEIWHTYLSGIGLVVVPNLHERDGIVGAHTSHLFRRLRRAIHRARAISGGDQLLGPDSEDEPVRFVATADPAYRDLGRFAERVVGRPFIVIGPEQDGAPIAPQLARVIPPATVYTDHMHPALWARSLARQAGMTAELFGFDDVLTKREHGDRGPLPEAQLIIARASAGRYAALPVLTSHLGWRAKRMRISDVGGISEPLIMVLWVPDREPFAELLATELPKPTDLGDEGRQIQRPPRLIASPQAEEVQRGHLHCTLAEDEVTLDELSRVFSRDIIREELDRLRSEGRILERTRRILNPEAGRVKEVHTVTLTGGADVHDRVQLDVAGEPVSMIDRSTGDELRSIPARRGLVAAYPGRVFLHHGHRYRVLSGADQDQIAAGRIWVEREDRPTLTSPMRRLAIELIERRHGPDRTTVREERTVVPSRNIGGTDFTLQHRNVRVTEEVLGVRRYAPDSTERDATIYDEAVTATYGTRAALLGLPPHLYGDVSVGTLHALAHLFRSILPAFIHHREEDLEVGGIELVDPEALREGDPPDTKIPTIAFVDTHPGGAGFADTLSSEIIKPVTEWAHLLLSECPAGCNNEDGCPSCLDIWRCHASPSHYRNLDKAGALRVVELLLGRNK